MKRLFTILLVCFSFTLFAQPCLPEGITFTTQAQIDSFNINYPGCNEIEGNVYIQGPDINNLEGLYVLDAIEGDLTIGGGENLGTSFVNLWGLNSLLYIGGGLFIEYNPNLTNLVGLQSLEVESLDSLSINNNPLLSLCDVYRICNYLANPDAKVFIGNNAPGCNSLDEVVEDCEDNCFPQEGWFKTQEEIDSFQEDYPGCTDIIGSLRIDGDDISTLQGLNVLTTIHGRLLIGSQYPSINNPLLTNLSGLENLSHIIMWLGIYWNSNLTSCTGLENLTHIGQFLSFWGNEDLINMNGFESLTSIGGYFKVYYNDELIDLSGLNSLTTIGDDLIIDHNYELTSLTGLESINYIGGKLYISDNYELMNLNGFSTNNPISLKGKIYINENTLITDLYGIENIETGSVNKISIHGNPSLSICEAQNICDYIADSTGIVEIYSNAPGCDNPEEVIEGCHSCIPEGIIFNTQAQVDSFQVNYPECFHIKGNVEIIGNNDITNLSGLNIILSIGGNLRIMNNENLTNLIGLENLVSIGGMLIIEGNETMTSLKGIQNIHPASIEDLIITNNPLLSICHVQSICEYLIVGYGYADIFDNNNGCNSPDEVETICLVNTDDVEGKAIMYKVYPTPTEKWLNIETQQCESPYNIEIRNLFGQILTEKKEIQSFNYSMNIADLKAGVYFYVIKEKGIVVQQGKLIKK